MIEKIDKFQIGAEYSSFFLAYIQPTIGKRPLAFHNVKAIGLIYQAVWVCLRFYFDIPSLAAALVYHLADSYITHGKQSDRDLFIRL